MGAKMKRKMIAAIMAITMTVTVLAGCTAGSADTTNATESNAVDTSKADAVDTSNADTIDTSKEVNVVLYLYGSEGVASPDILAELNAILKEKINATLEVKYIDWGDIPTKYPLLWASGEAFDMAYASSAAPVPFAQLARQDVLADLTEMLDTYAPALKAAIGSTAWDSTTVDGKVYAVPSTYSEFTANGFVSRADLMEKYEIEEIASIEDMEAYMDASVADGRTPLDGKSNLSLDMYRMFTDLTSDWIEAPGIPTSEPWLVGKVSDPGEILHPAFTDEFEEFAVKMREWSDAGYWSKDILSGAQDDKENFNNDLNAAFISHQPDWTGNKGTLDKKLPGVDTEFFCFPEVNGKIIRKMGSENATVISTNSKNPERTLMVIELLMTNEECYKLFQYGITGRQYEFSDGLAVRPDSYDDTVDGGGFAAWAFRTDALNIPYETEDTRRYILNDEWKAVAIDNPYVGFTFDNKNISAELSAVANVDSQLGIQLLLGMTTQDPRDAVALYRSQLEAAGIDKIVEEVKTQYAEFLETSK